MLAILEWVGTFIGLSGTFLLGWTNRTRTAGWTVMTVGSCVYMYIFICTGQWGLVAGSVVYIILEVIGLQRSLRDAH